MALFTLDSANRTKRRRAKVARLAGLAALSVRTILAVIMTAHGWQKLARMGPAGFGQGYRTDGH